MEDAWALEPPRVDGEEQESALYTPPSPGGVGPSALCKTGHPAGDGRVVSHPTRPFFSSAEPAPARRRRGRTRGSETTRPPLRGSAAETTRSTSTERSRKVRSRRRVPRSGVRPLRRRAARRRRGAGKCASAATVQDRPEEGESAGGEFGKREKRGTEDSSASRRAEKPPTLSCSRSGRLPPRRRSRRGRKGRATAAERVARGWRLMETDGGRLGFRGKIRRESTERSRKVRSTPPLPRGASGPAPSARQAIPRGTVASSLILRVRSSRQLSRRRHGDEEDGLVVLRRRVPRSGHVDGEEQESALETTRPPLRGSAAETTRSTSTERSRKVRLKRRVPRSGVRPLRRRAARRRRGAGKCALPPPSPGGVGPSALCKTGHPAGDGRVVSHPTRPFFSSAEPAPARRRRGRTRGSETTRPPLRDSASDAPHVDGEEQESALYPPFPGGVGPSALCKTGHPAGDGRVVSHPTRPFFSSAEPAPARRRRGRTRGSETTRPPLRGSAAETTRRTSTERSRKVRSTPPSPGASGPAPSARQAIPRGTVTSSLILRVRSSRQLSRRRHGDEKDGPVVLRQGVPRSGIRPLTRRTSTERSRKVRSTPPFPGGVGPSALCKTGHPAGDGNVVFHPTRPFFSSAEPAPARRRRGRTRGSETTRPPLRDSASDAPHVDGEEQETPSARQAIPRGTVTSSLILRVRSSRQLSRRRHGDEKDGPVVLRRRVPRSGIRPLTRRTSTERSRKVRSTPPFPGGVGPSALCKTGHPAGDGHVVSHPTRPFFSSAEPAPAWRRKGRTRGSETTRPPLRDSASDARHVDGEELPLLIRRRRYVCADLAEGDFSCPIDMLRKLARETYTHLLPRPTTIPSDPQSFSLTRVVDDMWSVLELVKSGWCDVSRPHRVIEYLQNKEGPSVTPAALICCVDDDSPGYLFEIIDAKGKRLKVTFNKWGFTFGSGLHFSGLTSLLSHICEVDGVHFVINCRFLLTASEPERPM
ncbi:Hypothetical predicted protein [Xyrichtys novacula]|uniref:Uncharacterized protein n=1 Tax=Xyrichtys novacula TaxID=13765 RepID=A0AAV1FNR2_XYRNO|nr:Hypothetical predicted protein [Xyrichtys novacula]